MKKSKRTNVIEGVVLITVFIAFSIIIMLALYPHTIYLYKVNSNTIQDDIGLVKEKNEAGKEKKYIVKSSWRDSIEVSEDNYIKWVKDYNTISINHKKLEVVELTYRFFGKVCTSENRCVAEKDYYPWDYAVENNYTIDEAKQLKELAFNEDHVKDIDYIKENISFECDRVYYEGFVTKESVDSMTLLD